MRRVAICAGLALAVVSAQAVNYASAGVYCVPLTNSVPSFSWDTERILVDAKSTYAVNALFDMVCERMDVPNGSFVFAADKRAETFPYSTSTDRARLAAGRELSRDNFKPVYDAVHDYLQGGKIFAPVSATDNENVPTLVSPLCAGAQSSVQFPSGGWRDQPYSVSASCLNCYVGNVAFPRFDVSPSAFQTSVSSMFQSFCDAAGVSFSLNSSAEATSLQSGIQSSLLGTVDPSPYYTRATMSPIIARAVPFAANALVAAFDTQWFKMSDEPNYTARMTETTTTTRNTVYSTDIALWMSQNCARNSPSPMTGFFNGSQSAETSTRATNAVNIVYHDEYNQALEMPTDVYCAFNVHVSFTEGGWANYDNYTLPRGSANPRYRVIVKKMTGNVSDVSVGDVTTHVPSNLVFTTVHRRQWHPNVTQTYNARVTAGGSYVDSVSLFLAGKMTRASSDGTSSSLRYASGLASAASASQVQAKITQMLGDYADYEAYAPPVSGFSRAEVTMTPHDLLPYWSRNYCIYNTEVYSIETGEVLNSKTDMAEDEDGRLEDPAWPYPPSVDDESGFIDDTNEDDYTQQAYVDPTQGYPVNCREVYVHADISAGVAPSNTYLRLTFDKPHIMGKTTFDFMHF